MWRYVRGRSTRVMRADRSMVVVVLESGEERVEQNRLSWNNADFTGICRKSPQRSIAKLPFYSFMASIFFVGYLLE